MPSKTDKIAIKDPFLDRRTKLLPCQKEMVAYWYGRGSPIREIARMFGVDRRSIQFILFPERLAENRARRLDRVGTTGYYDKDKFTIAMREHRQHKRKILSPS